MWAVCLCGCIKPYSHAEWREVSLITIDITYYKVYYTTWPTGKKNFPWKVRFQGGFSLLCNLQNKSIKVIVTSLSGIVDILSGITRMHIYTPWGEAVALTGSAKNKIKMLWYFVLIIAYLTVLYKLPKILCQWKCRIKRWKQTNLKPNKYPWKWFVKKQKLGEHKLQIPGNTCLETVKHTT